MRRSIRTVAAGKKHLHLVRAVYAVEALETRRLFSVFMVTNTSDSGAGSFRQAILDSNSNSGADVINFNIPGTGVQTIQPNGVLPDITDTVTIDGYTQTGASANTLAVGDNAVLKIVLDGSNNNEGSQNGLHITAPANNCVIRGIDFSGWIKFNSYNATVAAVNIESSGNTVAGNFFGTDASGEVGVHETNSIFIHGIIAGNTVGGAAPADRNIIAASADNNYVHGVGVWITQATGTTVQGNYVGTDAAGSQALGSVIGITIDSNAADTTVGGLQSGERNVISGNGTGIQIVDTPSSDTTRVEGNFIGTNATGTLAVPNVTGIDGGASMTHQIGEGTTIIGGTTAAARNIISGNTGDGINRLGRSPNTGGNQIVEGNYIGTDVTGEHALPNGGNGVVAADFTQAQVGPGNVISGNGGNGVDVLSEFGGVVVGNLIGTDAAGTSAMGNLEGVNISIDRNSSIPSDGATIGGTSAADRNVISGNIGAGIDVAGGFVSTVVNVIEGNYIGADITGAHALGNGGDGIRLANGPGSVIGGPTLSAGNLIAGNGGHGIRMLVRSTVQNNIIGTDLTGAVALGNHGAGITIRASGSLVGGFNGQNTIAFNSLAGVTVASGTGDSVLSNSIYANSGLGIDLAGDGVTANHVGAAAGPNHFQNFPVLSSATSANGTSTISGTLASTASTVFTIQFFTGAPDPSGHGQGKFYLGFTTVTTDGSGNASFNATVAAPVLPGRLISATATDAVGNTSEFAANIAVSGTGAIAQLNGNVLNVYSTAGNDKISVGAAGGMVTANVNGRRLSFPAASVASINVDAGDGADLVQITAAINATVMGGPGDDTLIGGGGNNNLVGGAGDDSITGGNGSDTLWGGIGNDTLIGGSSPTQFFGKAGNDLIFAHNGHADTIFGGTGNNTAHIDQGIDLIPNNDVESVLSS